MHSAPQIQAVVFDLDGLMFNTEDIFFAAGQELLARRNHAMTADVMNVMLGRRPLEAFANLKALLHLPEAVEELFAESQDIFHTLLERRLAPMPGLMELLQFVEERAYPKGVATSSPRGYVQTVLGRFELLPRFPIILTAEDVTRGKPDPEIYLAAAKRLNVSPSLMMVLEDTQTGVNAAAAAGAYVIAVPHQHTADHDFRNADYIADTLADPRIRHLLDDAAAAEPA